jgi:hypothetical protein
MKTEISVFDCRGISRDQVALFMADGKRVLIDNKQYFKELDRGLKKTEELNVREPERVRKPRNFRGGLTAKIERTKIGARPVAVGKRNSLRPANNQRLGLPGF